MSNDTTTRDLGDERPQDDLHDTGPHRHHQHDRGGHGHGRRHGPPAWLTDQPVGTSAEALAEAFLGVGQLLRGRARSHRHGPRQGRLTFARAALLATLDSDGPQRMGELAYRLGVVPRTVTPMVDALEGDGLLVRDPDPGDRRATVLRITDAGHEELVRTRSDRRNAVDEVFAGLSDDERGVLAGVLNNLRTAARGALNSNMPEDLGPDGTSEGDTRDGHSGRRPGVRGRRRDSQQRREHHALTHHHGHGHCRACHQGRPHA